MGERRRGRRGERGQDGVALQLARSGTTNGAGHPSRAAVEKPAAHLTDGTKELLHVLAADVTSEVLHEHLGAHGRLAPQPAEHGRDRGLVRHGLGSGALRCARHAHGTRA